MSNDPATDPVGSAEACVGVPVGMTLLRPPEGVPPEVWLKLAVQVGNEWRIKERNADGEVIGTSIRRADGSKGFVGGGHRGLILDWPFEGYEGTSDLDPVLLCEGASDTAAAMSLGFVAVGLPAANTAIDHAAQLFDGRHVVVVCDRDKAGTASLKKVHALVGLRASSVRCISAPRGTKDFRAWVLSGATRETVNAAIATAPTLFVPEPSLFSEIPHSSEEFEFVPLTELGESKPMEWIWKPLLSPGFMTLFTAAAKSGKTTLLSQGLRDLGRGTGLVDQKRDDLILIVSEEPEVIWKRRRDKLGLGANIRVLRTDRYGHLSMQGWQALVSKIALIVSETAVSTLILDTLSDRWPVEDENNAPQVQAAPAPLREISEKGVAILLCHHPRKSDGAFGQTARGSSALPAFVDLVAEMNAAASNSDDRILTVRGRLDEPLAEFRFAFADGEYTLLGSGADAKTRALAEAIKAILAGAPKPMKMKEVEDKLGGKYGGPNAIRECLKSGVARGMWEATPAGGQGNPMQYSLPAPEPVSSPPGPHSIGGEESSDSLAAEVDHE